MKQSTAAIVLLALVCGQAVQAGPIGAILTAPLAVVGGVANAAGQAAQAAVNTAAAVKKTVDDTVTDKVNFGVNTFASTFNIDWNKDLKATPTNFKVGKCTGNGYCFPKFTSAQTALPTLDCPKGYEAMKTLPVAGELMCVRKTPATANVCWKSLSCPTDARRSNQTCVDPKIQEVLTGVLVAFKLKASLPFTVVPALATAVKAAAVVKPQLAANVIKSVVNAKIGALAASKKVVDDAANTIKALVASATGVNITVVKSNPMEDLLKGLMTVNTTDIVPVLPQLQAFVDAALQGIANRTAEIKAATKVLPLCMNTCCKSLSMTNVELKLPAMVCPKGLKLDSLALVCSGKGSSYKACPTGMTKCPSMVGKRPVCVAAANVWGMNSCAIMTAMDVVGKLDKVACP